MERIDGQSTHRMYCIDRGSLPQKRGAMSRHTILRELIVSHCVMNRFIYVEHNTQGISMSIPRTPKGAPRDCDGEHA